MSALIPPNTVIIDHSGFPEDCDGHPQPVIRIGLSCDASPRLLLPMDHPKVAPALKMTSLEDYDAAMRPAWPDVNFQRCFPGREQMVVLHNCDEWQKLVSWALTEMSLLPNSVRVLFTDLVEIEVNPTWYGTVNPLLIKSDHPDVGTEEFPERWHREAMGRFQPIPMKLHLLDPFVTRLCSILFEEIQVTCCQCAPTPEALQPWSVLSELANQLPLSAPAQPGRDPEEVEATTWIFDLNVSVLDEDYCGAEKFTDPSQIPWIWSLPDLLEDVTEDQVNEMLKHELGPDRFVLLYDHCGPRLIDVYRPYGRMTDRMEET